MPFTIKMTVLAVLAIAAVIVAVEVFLLVDHLRCKRVEDGPKSKLFSMPAIAVHVIALTAVLCFCYGLFVEPYWLEVNEIRIDTDKLGNVKLRIVQISDLHCDTKMRTEEKLVRFVNAAKADIVVFTGDALNGPESIALFRKTMKGLHASIAKLAVRGNWYRGIESSELFEGTGFEILERDTVKFEKGGKEFYISGLNFWDRNYSGELLSRNSPHSFNVFLYHSPDLIEDITNFNVDLYLAGHTHGGQIALPFYGPVLTFSKFGKKYSSGFHRVGKTDLYVNRGVGMEGGSAPRARFLARPEITIFDIGGED
ncbi:MAG: hypothetical protein FVQ79_09205 [Planctomycetes bacterium]|nr:hypothetical protein [Planctomycetota bacterium]